MAQDVAGLCTVWSTVLGHAWLAAHPDPQDLFIRGAPQSGSLQPVRPQGVIQSQGNTSHPVLVEFHEVPVGPFLQLVYVFLGGSPAPEHIDQYPQFDVT